MYMYVYICHINQNITQAKALPTKRKKNFICILFSPYPFSGKRDDMFVKVFSSTGKSQPPIIWSRSFFRILAIDNYSVFNFSKDLT